MALSNAVSEQVSEISNLIQGFEKDPGEGQDGAPVGAEGETNLDDNDDTQLVQDDGDQGGDNNVVDIDDSDSGDVDADSADDVDDSDDSDGEGAEQALDDIATVQDFVKATGWELEDFYGLKVKLRGGGEVTFGEIKDQLQQIPEQKAALEKEKTQFESEKKQWTEQASQNLMAASGLSEQLLDAEGQIKALVNQYNSVDWAKFEKEKPGEAALAKQRMEEQYRIAVNQRDQAKHQILAGQQQAFKESRVREAQAAVEKHDAWRDGKVFSADLQAMDTMMTEFGFQPGSINQVGDHRQLLMLRELMTLRAKLAEAKDGLTKSIQGKKPPKVIGGRKRGKVVKAIQQKKDYAKKLESIKGADNRSKAAFIAENLLNEA